VSACPAGVEAYIRFFECMTRGRLSQLHALVTDDIHFVDPFNDVHGVSAMRRIFEEMFDHLEEPRFTVVRTANSGNVWFLRWHFTGRGKSGGKGWTIEGVSELTCAEDGRICSHIDHWDSGRQFYEMLPVLGWLIQFIRKRVAASAGTSV
jgi:steroid delta-isomerase